MIEEIFSKNPNILSTIFTKTFCAIIVFLSFLGQLKAQDAFDEGSFSIDLGTNLIAYKNEYGSIDGFSLPITARINKAKNSWLSIGPYAGYANYNYNGDYGDFNWKTAVLGMNGAVHFVPILYDLFDIYIDNNKYDIYTTGGIGAEYWMFDSTEYRSVDGNYIDMNLTLTVGLKYMLGRKFGVYVEGGRSVFGRLNLGISKTF